MALQRLKQGDEDEVKEVVNLFFDGNSHIKRIELFLSDEKNYLLVYKVEYKVVGFAYGYELQRFDGRKNMVYLHQIEVLKEYRKQGIGQQLMDSFIDLCKTNNCGKLFLITNKSLEPAVELYRRCNLNAPNHDDLVFSYEMK